MPTLKQKSNIKKLSDKELETKFENFLSDRRVEGKGVEHTHTAFGPPWGKFNIVESDMEDFMSMYSQLIGKCDLHITERPKEVGPLLIDIDWNFNSDHSERQYTDENIKYVISKYNNILKKYFKLNKGHLKAFVFQKENPTRKEDKETGDIIYKDGFHVVYPYLPLTIAMRYLIRDEVVQAIKEEDGFANLNYINTLEDVVDKSIIESNGWMMYGSKKHDGYYYILTDIYRYDYEKEDCSEFKKVELPLLLSNRKFNNEDLLEFKENINKSTLDKKITQVLEENSAKYRREQKEKQVTKSKQPKAREPGVVYDDDIENDEDSDEEAETDNQYPPKKKDYSTKNDIGMARKLIEILSDNRAKDYKEWISVCWALKTVSPTLFDAFDQFSKKCPSKYKKSECKSVWDDARNTGYTIRALHRWAREDNPEAYAEIIRNSICDLIAEAENGTENDIAKVIFEMYKDRYVCASIKHNIWYEFQGHRWVEVEAGYTLKNKMSDELTAEFAHLNANYYTQAAAMTRGKRDDLMRKAENIAKIINKLKKSSFKKAVLEECQSLFYDKTFEEQLDSNKDLIGFNNGVYNLKEGRFRAGVPEDYVTMSVGYDWQDYDNDHPFVAEIEELFKKMMREKDMNDYILTLLASYLDGHTKHQKVIIWTGCGSNGKSVSINFFEMAFGDYCGILPITVLTKKQAGSSNATPEMAMMRGKRFVVFQEPENDDKIYVGRMKELSGSDWVYARPLFRDPIRFKPQFKLVLTCNKLPHIDSTDGGTWRRLRVTPWESEFVDLDRNGLFYGQKLKENQFPKDYDIYDKLQQWKGVFMWLLVTKYYEQYKKQDCKLYEPEKVLAFTNKYKRDSDIYMEYLDENLIKTGNKKDYENVDVIYNAFKFWYKESYANSKCPSKKELRDYMESHEYECKKGHIVGVRFTNDDDIKDELDA